MPDLTGKIALVTGAGGFQGIGRAMRPGLGAGRRRHLIAVNDLSPGPPVTGRAATRPAWGGIDAVVDEIRRCCRRAPALVR